MNILIGVPRILLGIPAKSCGIILKNGNSLGALFFRESINLIPEFRTIGYTMRHNRLFLRSNGD